MVPIAIVVVAVIALCVGPAPAADVSYFEVPRGAHPHDVAPAPDGSIWYTAQSQGALGILNPKTGQAIQISLGKGSAPHGVIVGPDRAAWITDGGQNAIARFEPATKAVKLFPLPKEFPDANLNTATARASFGLPDRTVCMAGWTLRAARLKPGRRQRDLGPMASRRRRMEKFGTRPWPAITL